MAFIKGFTGLLDASHAVTIANGAQSSSVLSCGGMVLKTIFMPATFTGTAITFEVCDTVGGTYLPLYDKSNAQVSITVAVGRAYAVDSSLFEGIAFLKIKSGSSEGGARTIVCSLKG